MLAALFPLAPLLALPQSTPALENGLVRSIELEALPGTFVQHFRFEREDGREAPPLGWLRYLAGTSAEGRRHLELELQFVADDVRLIHVEESDDAQRRLVFRELSGRAGRTLFLEGAPGGILGGYELGGPQVVRCATPDGGELPLSVLEMLRSGALPAADLSVFDPLATAFESLTLTARALPEGRLCEARRSDGSLRWRLVTEGGELRELRFQERGPVARPIAREEYERLRAEHELAASVAREAASPLASLRRARGLRHAPVQR